MMSRAAYRGMKIEWYPDECALPLPKHQRIPKREIVPQSIKESTHAFNRFQILNMNGTEDGSNADTEDEEGVSTILTEDFTAMQLNHRSPWNPTVAA